MTQLINLKREEEKQTLKEVAEAMRKGELVVFPTETVYGIGTNALREDAVEKIFEAKGRAQDNPLILHVSSKKMLSQIVQEITEVEQKLMDAFWPGPFTIILRKKEVVPSLVTGGLETVAVRMPSEKIAQELIELAGVPIAAPSANRSGKPSGTNIQDIIEELSEEVAFMIDGGDCEIGLESTVVRVIDDVPYILRPGKITAEQIKVVVGSVKIDQHVLENLEENVPVLSPGMKYKHYAPESKCILVYSQKEERMIEKINEIANQYKSPLIIAKAQNIHHYPFPNKLVEGKNLEEISKNVFKILRKVDDYHPDIVLIEGVKNQGLGLAIMNRLIRACGHRYIEC